MQFTSVALPILGLLAFASAHPAAEAHMSLAPRGMVSYPAGHTLDMIKRAHLEARCDTACPCITCGRTICCKCNC
ncbi:hypothetical protein CC86DRAFT_289510 [Ophiobolus disseminans]|uniref:Uncharacterized protein n=1 Tax=Ophiobolus disseminans TaxID=1469910 RepID=A0A6A7A5M0_9PLEO|nr:hypothetical protein CC86DRAFT_289510 [Ophiobolus disseminans]